MKLKPQPQYSQPPHMRYDGTLARYDHGTGPFWMNRAQYRDLKFGRGRVGRRAGSGSCRKAK